MSKLEVDLVAIRQILGKRVQDLMADLLAPCDDQVEIVMRGLGGNFNKLDGGIDPESLYDAIVAMSHAHTAINLVITALVQTKKQLDCDHDWRENRLSIHVGTISCRKCDLTVEARYKASSTE